MAHIHLPARLPGIRALLAFRPEPAAAIAELTNTLLHGPSTLSRGERELIAARVSSLNDCAYCRDSHAAIAACHFADDERFVHSVIESPDEAGISDKLKALLVIAERVQESGRAVTEADVSRARQHGATDVEIHDTVLIAAAFCMFNRYVDGLAAGTAPDPGRRERARMVATHGYSLSMPTPDAVAR